MASKEAHKRAHANGKRFTDRVVAVGGRCMEQVIDRTYVLYFERWLLPNGVAVVVMYGEQYGEIFIQAAPFRNDWDATEGALNDAAALASVPK